MFIAHAPVGYISARIFAPMLSRPGVGMSMLVAASLAGAVAPDLDLVWFFLVDHRQHPHHAYVTHWPVLWAGILAISLGLLPLCNASRLVPPAVVFALGGFVHMILDSVAGDIRWFAPWSDQSYSLVAIRALYRPWWLNFLLHWTFLLELTICSLAVLMYCRPSSSPSPHPACGWRSPTRCRTRP